MKIVTYSAGIGFDKYGKRYEPKGDLDFFFDHIDGGTKFKDDVMSAKMFKVLPHKLFSYNYIDWTIWVDSNVILKVDPEFLVNKIPSNKEVGVFPHWDRDCLYEEAKVCIDEGLDSYSRIMPQIMEYKHEGFPRRAGLGMCFLIARKHTDRVAQLNEKWWAEICMGSIRDQISFPYVFRDSVHYFPRVNGNDCEYFKRIV